jgi:formylglycine-generating enzyme required for sulfatase activity
MIRRWMLGPAMLVGLLLGAGALSAPAEIASHLGNTGPSFEAGLTPSKLGWGADDKAYPDKLVVNPVDLAEMVWVPGGTFRMGSTDEGLGRQWKENGWEAGWTRYVEDERPQHEVTISRGFWLCKHEVTNGQYARFVEATGHAPHALWDEYKAHDRLPVSHVTWDDCVAYAQWAGGALPTEAQWEWSARGPEGRMYPWGSTWDRTKCNSAEYWAGRALPTTDAWTSWVEGVLGGDMVTPAKEIAHLRDVGSYPSGASWCGAVDLAGSAWEWCSDWYGPYAAEAVTDPGGPGTGDARVLRGGGWCSDDYSCRSANRNYFGPVGRNDYSGFRVARAG